MTFLQEFESYHLVKFNRGPKIIKKKVTSGKDTFFTSLIKFLIKHNSSLAFNICIEPRNLIY